MHLHDALAVSRIRTALRDVLPLELLSILHSKTKLKGKKTLKVQILMLRGTQTWLRDRKK